MRDGLVEVVRVEAAADDLRERAGAAADGEREVGRRRAQSAESARATASRARRDLAAGRRIVGQVRAREAKRAEVGRADPGGAEQRGADGDLGRAAADVDHCDDLAAASPVGAGDGAVEGEPALALRR